ncbi:hypothetical protein PR048_008532 [Dryococelus australis]|uniref:PiggyBac transposable element-derived protein domain-containing protein n=1 Tax=Dryococelus australis TaxID=614101 RepID=A0ABQ9HXE0_9NEOP|nr:hypothetical protein PR048_008532 [Dryococelus australis]
MARRCGVTTEQALRYFQDICETNSGSENSDNYLSSGDEYIPQNSDNGADSDEEPEVFQDAEVRQKSQTTNPSVTLERNEPTAVQQASQMEVEKVKLAPQDDRSQSTCSRRALCGIRSGRRKKTQHVKQTKSSSLKKMPSETATVMQPQGSVPSVRALLPIGHTEVAKDGTEGEVIDFGNNLSGRRGTQNAVRENSGRTLHASPCLNITVDEKLFPTKARCSFMQYMAKKPDKFGIKFWIVADVDSKYLVNGFPYLGKEDDRSRSVNRTRREVPPNAKDFKQQLYATYVHKHKDTILTVYQEKVNRNVILLSSLHPSVSIAEIEKKTPETIQYYNATKFGVDIMDQMERQYSVKSVSRHWPVHVFFNMLDLACMNAWTLYEEVTGRKIKSWKFILELCEELRAVHMANRNTKPHMVSTGDEEMEKSRKKCGI